MNYHEIIAQALTEKALVTARENDAETKRQSLKQRQIATLRGKLPAVVAELETARLALAAMNIPATLSHLETAEGPSHTLRFPPTRRGAVHGLVFQALVEEPIFRPELHTYRLQDGHTPQDPLDHSKPVGIGPDFTAEQVQKTIAAFLQDALQP